MAAKIETKAREKVELRLEVHLAMTMDQTNKKDGEPTVQDGYQPRGKLSKRRIIGNAGKSHLMLVMVLDIKQRDLCL